VEHRIVSLIASATEIVAGLGKTAELVACSHECDYPAEVKQLPVVTRPRINVHATSREIDDEVRACVANALSVYDIEEEAIDQLHPTVIITQSQCEVCAVNLKEVELAVGRMVQSKPKVVSLEPMKLSDVWEDIRAVASALGIAEAGNRLVVDLKTRLENIASTARKDVRGAPRVLCIEWLDPIMTAGNWVPELVQIAGGIPIAATIGEHSPTLEWEDVIAADPDIIAVMPCGFDMSRTWQEMNLLTDRPGWSELQAVKNGNVFVTDGNQYFNRPGPRVVESAEILLEILNPSCQRKDQLRSGWKKFDGSDTL